MIEREQMLFEWTDQKLELYVRASEHTGFHRKLAAYISPLLQPDDTVIDIGCGPGLIDIALAPHVKSLTGFDIDDSVVQYLKSEAERTGLSNVAAVTADISEIRDLSCDVALMCYFGFLEDCGARVIDAAKRFAVVITHGTDTTKRPSKISTAIRRPYAADIEDLLKSVGYDYERFDDRLDFGQPLKSVSEAREFLDIYCADEDPAIRAKRIDAQLKQLQSAENDEYPYFFPYMKNVAIFLIRK